MRAILLDPTNDSRTVIDLGDGLSDIYKAIGNGCQTFSCPITLDNGDGVYCDDEGLFNDIIGAFMDMNEWSYPLVGRILIVGTDEDGDSVDCKSEVSDFDNWTRLPANDPNLINWFNQYN
jgi:hypothetical protein